MNKYFIIGAFALFVGSSAYPLFDVDRAIRNYRNGDYSQAQERLEKLLTDDHDNQALLYNLGKCTYAHKDYAQAARYFERAAQARGDIPQLTVQALFDAGNAYVQQQEWQKALDAYQKLLTLQAEHKEAQEMVERLKKKLEEQKKEQEQQKNDDKKKQDNDKKQDQKKDQNNNKSDSDNKKNEDKEDSNKDEEQEQQQSNKQKSEKQQQQKNDADKKSSQQKPDEKPADKKQGEQEQKKSGNDKEDAQAQAAAAQDARDANASPEQKALAAWLEQYEQEGVKALLRSQVKQEMSGQHGYKNW